MTNAKVHLHQYQIDILRNLSENDRIKMANKARKYVDDPKIKQMLIISKPEESVCQHIREQLCVVLGISPTVLKFKDIGISVGTYLQTLVEEETNITFAKVQQLQTKYPCGAVILFFASVAHFKSRLCQRTFYSSIVPNECILNHETGIFYAPKHILESMGNIKYPILSAQESKHKYLIISAIYNNFPITELSVTYHWQMYDIQSLQTFFKRRKWKASVLRTKYPYFLDLFQSENSAKLLEIMRQSLGLDSKCIKDSLHKILPHNFLQFITQNKEKILVQTIISTLYRQCKLRNNEWKDWCAHFHKVQRYLTHTQRLNAFYCKFPFIFEGISKIRAVIGSERFRMISWTAMQETMVYKKNMDLMNLISKIEGRKCSYQQCTKQENRDDSAIEKYKTCSGCRMVFYCSKSCQKRDWIRKHRHSCCAIKETKQPLFNR